MINAIGEVIDGTAPDVNPAFAPKPAELAILARRHVAIDRADLLSLKELLEATAAATFRADAAHGGRRARQAQADLSSPDRQRRTEAAARVNAALAVVDEQIRIRGCKAAGIDPHMGVSVELWALHPKRPGA